MKHKHHIIPKHMGGTDDPNNIIELTVHEHSDAHLKLYEKYGKHEDLCAYYMLSGKIEEFRKIYGKIGGTKSQQKRKDRGLTKSELFYGKKVSEEEIFKNCSKGGTKQGKLNAITGHMKKIQKLSDTVSSGRKGGLTTVKLKKGSFGDSEQRKKVAVLGGKVQGRINAENGHCKKIAIQYWEKIKNGTKIRNKKMWITNGVENKLLNFGEKINDGWRKGKIQKKKVY